MLKISMAVFMVVVIATLAFVNVQASEPCILPVGPQAPLFTPFVYTTTSNALYPVHSDKIKINSGEKAVLTCQNNFFKRKYGEHEALVTCEDGHLSVGKETKEFKDFACDLKVMEELKHSVEGCDNKHQGILYTYYDNVKKVYIKTAEACYDFNLKQLKFIRTTSSRSFPTPEMELEKPKKPLDNVDVQFRVETIKTFRADSVRRKLSLISDDIDVDMNTVDSVGVLPRIFFNGQLQEIERHSTNKVAMWKSVAGGNWKRVISDINEYTSSKNNTLELIMGTHGTLKINKRDIFLGENDYPVPNYSWVIVNDKVKKAAVAIVTVNNPYATVKQLKEQIFCDNKCSSVKWLTRTLQHDNYDRPISGYTFCCSPDAFDLYPLQAKQLLVD